MRNPRRVEEVPRGAVLRFWGGGFDRKSEESDDDDPPPPTTTVSRKVKRSRV